MQQGDSLPAGLTVPLRLTPSNVLVSLHLPPVSNGAYDPEESAKPFVSIGVLINPEPGYRFGAMACKFCTAAKFI